MPELALTGVQGLIELVAEVARGDHAERAHRGQRARFRTAEGVVVVAVVDVFAVKSTWQIDVVRKHVAWIDLLPLTRVRPGAAQIARVATRRGNRRPNVDRSYTSHLLGSSPQPAQERRPTVEAFPCDKYGTNGRGFGWAGVAPDRRITQ